MAEFALLVGGLFREFRALSNRPPNIPHKMVEWHPVVRDYGEPFEGLDGDDYRVTIPEPVPPDPGMTPPSLTAATFNLTIENGDITSIGAAFNLIGALYLGVGQYELFFLQPQPDLEFTAKCLAPRTSAQRRRVSTTSTSKLAKARPAN